MTRSGNPIGDGNSPKTPTSSSGSISHRNIAVAFVCIATFCVIIFIAWKAFWRVNHRRSSAIGSDSGDQPPPEKPKLWEVRLEDRKNTQPVKMDWLHMMPLSAERSSSRTLARNMPKRRNDTRPPNTNLAASQEMDGRIGVAVAVAMPSHRIRFPELMDSRRQYILDELCIGLVDVPCPP